MDERTREALIERLVAQYRQSLRQHLQRQPRTLDEIEQVVEDVSREMDTHLERSILDGQPRPETHENRARCSQCGGCGRYRDTVPRTLVTRHGEQKVWRRVYHCPQCQQNFAPLDQTLALDRGTTTTTVRLLAAHLGAHLAFAQGTYLLELLTGLTLGESTLERLSTAVGSSLRRTQQQEAENHRLGRATPVERKPARLYVSVDGIMTPLRDPWKRDGSAGKLVCRFGECKTAVIYEARVGARGDEGVARRAYTATFQKVERFGPLVATMAHRCGHHFAREVIFLADGQAYNWSLAAAHFPTAIQIVDLMHGREHLYAVARPLLGEGSGVEEWVKARHEELMTDRVEAVQAAIAQLPARTAEHREVRTSAIGYFRSNAERMRYGTFRKRGYQIATGVMEAACKQVVHQRLDQVGMHWRQETAEAVVTLRAALLSSTPPNLRPHCVAAC
jgi:hypothetical protein